MEADVYRFKSRTRRCGHCGKRYVSGDGSSSVDGYCSYECGSKAQPDKVKATISTGLQTGGKV